MSSSLAFVNDWGILSNAVEELREAVADHLDCDPDYCDLPLEFRVDFAAILEWVPKLIESWSELWELSVALTTAVEAQRLNQTPQGLYLPDTSTNAPERL